MKNIAAAHHRSTASLLPRRSRMCGMPIKFLAKNRDLRLAIQKMETFGQSNGTVGKPCHNARRATHVSPPACIAQLGLLEHDHLPAVLPRREPLLASRADAPPELQAVGSPARGRWGLATLKPTDQRNSTCNTVRCTSRR